MGEARMKKLLAEEQEDARRSAEAERKASVIDFAQIVFALRIQHGKRGEIDLAAEAEHAFHASEVFHKVSEGRAK